MAKVHSEKELIDRYVFAVTHKLPQRQRSDIEQELRSLIEDMLEERAHGGEIALRNVDEVLVELGEPRVLAAKYRETKRYLIGPELFDLYWVILKIVAFWSFIGMTVVFAIQSMFDPNNVIKLLVDYIVSVFTVGVQAIAWVTISFAIMEYAGVKIGNIDKKKGGSWHPSQLPPILDEKKRIQKSGPITAIIFTVLFMVGFVFSENLFGIHRQTGTSSYTFIPFWNKDVLIQLRPLFYCVLGLLILRECIKLYFGKWTKRLTFNILAMDAVLVIFYCFIFADQTVWNPNFMNELIASGIVSSNEIASIDSYTTVYKIWDLSRARLLPFIIIVMIIETAFNFYKAYKVNALNSKV